VDGISIGMGELTLETLLDQSFPVYATAVVALATIVRLFDEVSSFRSLSLLRYRVRSWHVFRSLCMWLATNRSPTTYEVWSGPRALSEVSTSGATGISPPKKKAWGGREKRRRSERCWEDVLY
jgi:hypothetical protein